MHPLEPAPVLLQMRARLIDWLLATPIALVVGVGLGLVLRSIGLDEVAADTVGLTLGMVFGYVVVETVLLAQQDGQTVGKRVVGLRVVRADGAGAPGVARLLVRVVALMGLFVVAGSVSFAADGGDQALLGTTLVRFWWVGVMASVVVAFIDRTAHRSLHDRVAGTRVVLAPKPPRAAARPVRDEVAVGAAWR